jgi:hypothetical protein
MNLAARDSQARGSFGTAALKKTCLLRCFKGNGNLKSGEGILALMVEDASAPEGMRIVTTASVGKLRGSPQDRIKNMRVVFKIAARLLGPEPKT